MMTSLIHYILSCLVKEGKECRSNSHNIPLPPECHKVLTETEIGNRPVFAIGDVHGCIEELTELMDKAHQIAPTTIYIFVGDLVNRGPDSVGVIRKLRRMVPSSAYAVRGNHDESVLREAIRWRENSEYALPDKYEWIIELSDDDFQYLSELPYTIEIPSLNSLIVHAGIIPGRPLKRQILNDLTNMRNIIDRGDQFEGGLIGTNKHEKGEPWIDLYPGPMHVYFGHDARRKLQKGVHATGLDTGCCHGDALTGVFINIEGPQQFVSVISRQPKIHE